jgi:hypothetical protein
MVHGGTVVVVVVIVLEVVEEGLVVGEDGFVVVG